MLPQTAEYALAAMAHLASQDPDFCTVPAIAEGAGLPEHYTYKIVGALHRAGLVVTHRARGGGVKLSRKPRAMTLLQIVNAVAPLDRLPAPASLVPLSRWLDAIVDELEGSLSRVTLVDVATAS